MVEEDRTDDRNPAQAGDGHVTHAGNRLGSADEVAEERSSRAYAEHLESDAGNALRSAEGDDDHAEEESKQGTDDGRKQETEPVPAPGDRAAVSHEEGHEHADEGAHRHDALAAEVEDSASLVEHLAYRGEQQCDGEGNRHGEDVYEQIHIRPPSLKGAPRSSGAPCPPDSCSGGPSGS